MFLEVILPLLLLLATGLAARTVEILTEFRVAMLNKVAFYVALPALVFHSIHSRSFGGDFFP